MTVVWSRPPNACPILGSDRSVSSRHRYIAIWRAVTRTRERLQAQRASVPRPKKGAARTQEAGAAGAAEVVDAQAEVGGRLADHLRCGDLRGLVVGDEVLEDDL